MQQYIKEKQLDHLTGMRAYLGVFPVIIFHIYPNLVPGGFLGVDIFFVISGFLIVKILSEQNLKFFEFYERRIRRIFPLVILVLLLSSIIALFLFLPSDFRIFSRNLAAASLYLSNWAYLLTTGYMAQVLDFDPIVHTWSLGIEIFFYLTFPILILLLKNYNLQIKLIIITLLLIISYLIYFFYSYKNDPSIFFSYQGRYWEFMIGVLSYYLRNKFTKKIYNNFFIFDGLIIFAVCIIFYNFMYTDRYGNLAINSLIICMFSALIIICGDRVNLVNHLISSKIIIYFGTISFGMYLWHKPLIAFLLHHADKTQLSLLQATYVIIFTISLSILSYHFYENYMRKKNVVKLKNFFFFITSGIIFLLLFGIYGWKSDGLPERFNSRVVFLDSQWKDVSELPNLKCISADINEIFTKCSRGSNTDDDPYFILLGDSHAASLIKAFDEVAIKNNFKYINLALPGCGLGFINSKIKNECSLHLNLIEEMAKKEMLKHIPLIIFTLRHRDELLNENKVQYKETNLQPHLNFLKFLSEYTNNMVIIEPIPAWKFNIPKRLAKKIQFLNTDEHYEVTQSEKDFKISIQRIMSKYEKLSHKPSVKIFRTTNIFCGKFLKDKCSANYKDRVFYMDDNHLSKLGSKILVEEFFENKILN